MPKYIAVNSPHVLVISISSRINRYQWYLIHKKLFGVAKQHIQAVQVGGIKWNPFHR